MNKQSSSWFLMSYTVTPPVLKGAALLGSASIPCYPTLNGVLISLVIASSAALLMPTVFPGSTFVRPNKDTN